MADEKTAAPVVVDPWSVPISLVVREFAFTAIDAEGVTHNMVLRGTDGAAWDAWRTALRKQSVYTDVPLKEGETEDDRKQMIATLDYTGLNDIKIAGCLCEVIDGKRVSTTIEAAKRLPKPVVEMFISKIDELSGNAFTTPLQKMEDEAKNA